MQNFNVFTTFLLQLIIAVEMNLVAPLAPYLSEYFGISPSSVVFFQYRFFYCRFIGANTRGGFCR